MATDFLLPLTAWHWLIFGVVMIVVEMLAPGIVFLWIGIAAIVTGLIFAVLQSVPWQYQLVVFGVLAPLSIYCGRRFVRSREQPTDHPALNRRGAQYVGRSYRLAQPLQDGNGKLVIDDTQWALSGPDLPAGTMVKVVGLDGTRLVVEVV
jgi:membrane protein implicated in regulation of membrane protease activity